MSTKTISLTENVYQYILKHGLREEPVLQELRIETAKLPSAMMQISPEQGQFIKLLIQIIAPRLIIEIGTFTGYSSTCMCLSLPSDGKLIACDISEEYTNMAKRYWQKAGLLKKIDLKIGPALSSLDQFLKEGMPNKVDFIFIDADKANYINYYERGLSLLRPGGLMAIDNVLWGGLVADPSVNDKDTMIIRELNNLIHQDKRVDLSLLPLGDGLTLVRKR
ncbi:MAG: class I SAM-dependent methyltransferase [Alphaproteobacteria bacterium]|nr:class I SAM-dependent methyltransferase [Alphaproteobacteria bacterium]